MTVFRELAQHILDIVENSVNAGATQVYISIDENLDRLSITIQDNGRGMNSEMVKRVTDPWVTTRTTRKVGLGIPFFKQTAEMTNGSFKIESTPGVGTLIAATFQHSHIDRPPLGDITGTLLCIIVGYPRVDIIYRHQINEHTFSLDTREIRAILGEEIPLSDPEVLGYLRGTLEEGLQPGIPGR
ncbi:MAG: sensor histidine kinase [Anaerolineae bacterium]|nr:sensor histidine kinase [Anaerolineae bacterium]